MPKPGFFHFSQTVAQNNLLQSSQSSSEKLPGLAKRSRIPAVTHSDYACILINWSIAAATSGLVFTFLDCFGLANETLFMAFMEALTLVVLVCALGDYTENTKTNLMNAGIKLWFMGMVVYGLRDSGLSLSENILSTSSLGLFVSTTGTFIGEAMRRELMQNEGGSQPIMEI